MADIIEDFSFPLQPFSGHEVGIFWDVEDYSFPEEDRDNPDLIYEKIFAIVGPVIADAKISIWAYVDETDEYWKDKLVKKTWEHSIYFLPRGDKMTRRMFHDILFWAKDTPEVRNPDARGFYYERYLIVISNQVSQDKLFFEKLGVLNDMHERYIVCIKLRKREPDQVTWPESVFKQVYAYSDDALGMECESEQGSSKKQKLLPEGSKEQGNSKKQKLLPEGSKEQGNSKKQKLLPEGSKPQG